MGVLFSVESVGRVTGLDLGRRRIVVKEHQPRWKARFLRGTTRIQAFVAASGFPCPAPIAGPFAKGDRQVTVETYLDDPGQEPVVPEMLAVSARGLAALAAITDGLPAPELADHPMRPPPGRLYPAPHSAIFDFDATADGAAWIDELAAAARPVRDADGSPPVVLHGDRL